MLSAPNCNLGMKVSLLVAAVVLCAIASASARRERVSRGDDEALLKAVDSNLLFSNSLYRVLSGTPGNLFFSPASIELILAMMYLGADGETANQIAKGLYFDENKEVNKLGLKSLVTSLQANNDITLESANKIYADQRITIKQQFKDAAEDIFSTKGESLIEGVDFARDAEQARLQINQWVKEKTHQKIKDLFPQGSITRSTTVVLVNAVYFKGNCKVQFNPAHTRKEPFFETPGSSKIVDMMHLTDYFRYAHFNGLGVSVLQMPYKGGDYAMLLILPDALDGLSEFESKMGGLDFSRIFSQLDRTEVAVSLPKFKLQKFYDLEETLKQLDMGDMFTSGADFRLMTKEGIHVSNVVHKAFIEVNEEGSEAAAATGASFFRLLASLPFPEFVVEFTADHPFMFAIVDTRTHAFLFSGRLSKFN